MNLPLATCYTNALGDRVFEFNECPYTLIDMRDVVCESEATSCSYADSTTFKLVTGLRSRECSSGGSCLLRLLATSGPDGDRLLWS